MSRLRCIFQSPAFRSYSQSRAGRKHPCPKYLELPLQSGVRWSYFWYAGILALGVTAGLGARQFAAPLGLPNPGSPEDKLIVESLGADVDKLDIVQSLRKQSFNLHSDTALTGTGVAEKSKVKSWVEVDFDFVKGEEAEGRTGILSALSGTRGFGVQRAFWNAETKEMVAVVWIGGGLAGWPGVAHGGAIATIFEETMARMVRGPNGAVEAIHRPTSLSITYAKPTYSLDFYILRASFSQPNLWQAAPPPEPESEPTKSWLGWLSPKKDLTKQVGSQQSAEIIGTLESVKGDLCVKVKGTFAVDGPGQ
ncbi:hypothetical protein HBH98_111700 [Parastagonospora nodorum]|nr:hypothetical protein HBI09_057020 [Parastagonospora nodorum]KAH4065550.1 hypothetical protein HBH50_158030 [Parastagonospora nodorum]KAH4092040.1 hypothetical protein HBH48_081090 [Parastagonospora nodorum]KAH4106565.1 hypothetical protein HBH46_071410 [Parastagonospora nodorum]KAH4174131.1 hypothetical protein HBH43_072190 [Parastagonospora nodorum]